jgi:hypothetical protein
VNFETVYSNDAPLIPPPTMSKSYSSGIGGPRVGRSRSK